MGAQLHDVKSIKFRRMRNETILCAVQRHRLSARLYLSGVCLTGLSERQDA
jgi:hypothetical protein